MFDPLKSLEKHLGEFDFNSRVPHYNDDSDYTTNAPSYYDDLARKNKLIKHLAMRIWDYDKELQKRFDAWDKNLEEFDDEVLRLLKEWMNDGTFDHIINEVLFGELNDKIDNNYNELKNDLNDISLNLRDFGVIPDGVKDNTNSIKNALEYADGRPLLIPDGTVKINGDIDYKGKVNLVGSGENSILDLSDGGSLQFLETPERITNIETDLLKNTSKITFQDRHGLEHGDVFVLYNPRDFSFSDLRAYYRDGCMFEVNNTTTTSLDIFGVSPETYESSLFEAWKLNGQGVTLKDFKVIPSQTDVIQIFIDGHVNVNIDNIFMPRGTAHTGIDIYRCYNVNVLDVNANSDSGNSYPVMIANSQKIKVSSNSLTSKRHSLAIGGREGDLSIPVRDMKVYNSILLNDQTSGVAASDMHANVVNVSYTNCTINSVANISGKNTELNNCLIYARDNENFNDGNAIWGSQVIGGDITINDCTIITGGRGTSFGYVQLSTSNLKENLTLNINNLNIINDNDDGVARAVTIGVFQEQIYDINININGMTSKKQMTGVLNFNGDYEITDNSRININNINIPELKQIIMANNTENYNKKMRLPSQSGKFNMTLNEGDTDTVISGSIFYNIPLPAEPSLQISVYTRSNYKIISNLQSVYNNRFRVIIESMLETGFVASEEVEVHWSAQLDTL